VGLWCGNFGNWRYPGTLPLLWNKRYRNRQVEEVSNRLTEDGSSKFEKLRRKKVEASWGGSKLIKQSEDGPLRNKVLDFNWAGLSRWIINRVEIVRFSGYTGVMMIEGFSRDAVDFCGSTGYLANRSPCGLDIGFLIKAAKSFSVTPCDIFTKLNSKSVWWFWSLEKLHVGLVDIWLRYFMSRLRKRRGLV